MECEASVNPDAIFGIGSIDRDGVLLDHHRSDGQFSAATPAIARTRFVALDQSKVNGGEAILRFGHVRDIDAVFPDAAPPTDVARMVAANKVCVVAADAAVKTAAAPMEHVPAPLSYLR